MKKEMQNKVFEILTSHQVYGNGTDFSISMQGFAYDDFEYYSITLFPNNAMGSFHDGYAEFFISVARVLGCSCSFRSLHGVCVCKFY